MSAPEDELERAIRRGQTGESTVDAVLDELMTGRMIVPSGAAYDDGRGTFQPVLFDRRGVQYLAVFTSSEKAKRVMPPAVYAASMTGRQVMRSVAPGLGVVVNPGFTVGLEIDPATVVRLADASS